jgi:hypothetical protein
LQADNPAALHFLTVAGNMAQQVAIRNAQQAPTQPLAQA